MRRATIYDVAREAGVSHQTVTRFLNGFEGIRPATRERVQAALLTLDYQPNSAARWLRSQRTNRIGILAHRIELGGPGRIVAGATAAARARGYVVDIASMDSEDAESVDAAFSVVMEHQIAGVFATVQTEAVREAVARRAGSVPISMGAVEGTEDAGSRYRRTVSGRLAADHLADLGHRRVAFVGGPAAWLTSGERREGFFEQSRERGVEVVWEHDGDWSAQSGYEAAGQAPIRASGVTAVALANDSMAIGFIYGLAELGMSVPGDVSVIGTDDAPESRFHIPSLSTVRLDFEGDGAALMNILIAKIEGNLPPEPEPEPEPAPQTRPSLIARASTAAI